MNTSELDGVALDWAVLMASSNRAGWYEECGLLFEERGEVSSVFQPSARWAQGGPILESHPIQVGRAADREGFAAYSQNGVSCVQYGPTMLIAGMRCYVAAKLGDEVEIPGELLER